MLSLALPGSSPQTISSVKREKERERGREKREVYAQTWKVFNQKLFSPDLKSGKRRRSSIRTKLRTADQKKEYELGESVATPIAFIGVHIKLKCLLYW